jgi:organic radical activating enzyme
MITGGEPFLYAKQMGQILTEIGNECPFIRNVEIETNGTLHNEKTFKEFFTFRPDKFKITLNISPKLGPECWADKKTPMQIINTYVENSKTLMNMIYDYGFDYYYKIVYDKSWSKYIDKFLDRVPLPYDKRNPSRRIYMMPKTPDFRDYKDNEMAFMYKFRESCNDTVNFCLERGLKFSCREHVWIWYDKKNEFIEVDK